MKEKSFIDDIRAALAQMKLDDTPKTARDIVAVLKSDIMKYVKEGHKPKNIYDIIQDKLPDDIKMSYATFNKYYLEMRRTSGIGKIRRQGKAIPHPAPPPTSSQTFQEVTPAVATMSLSTVSNEEPVHYGSAPVATPESAITQNIAGEDVVSHGMQAGPDTEIEDELDVLLREVTDSFDQALDDH